MTMCGNLKRKTVVDSQHLKKVLQYLAGWSDSTYDVTPLLISLAGVVHAMQPLFTFTQTSQLVSVTLAVRQLSHSWLRFP